MQDLGRLGDWEIGRLGDWEIVRVEQMDCRKMTHCDTVEHTGNLKSRGILCVMGMHWNTEGHRGTQRDTVGQIGADKQFWDAS